MFGQEIYMSLSEEQAGIGAAIMAAVGTGAYADYQEACGRIVEFSDDVVEPDEERRKIYEERFQIFQELYRPTGNCSRKTRSGDPEKKLLGSVGHWDGERYVCGKPE